MRLMFVCVCACMDNDDGTCIMNGSAIILQCTHFYSPLQLCVQ